MSHSASASISAIRGRSRPLGFARRCLFGVMAIGLSLAPIVLFEGLCMVAGWGRPRDDIDPFVGFENRRPLFVADESHTKYATADNRRRFFKRDEFACTKPPRTFRIFCLGESTVQGEPYSIETAFPAWLELALNAADMSRSWEVINCGGISYASYRLAPILEEVLHYEPDLIILCVGHNEFLEDRTYPELKRLPSWSQAPVSWLARRRTTVLLSRMFPQRSTQANDQRVLLATDTEPMLDFNNGIAAYHWDPAWQAGIVEHYEFNMRRMIELCRASGVPVVVMQPASNLSDSPPFKSEHRSNLSALELDEIQANLVGARRLYSTSMPQAIGSLRKALEIDPQFALTWYELGQAYEAMQQHELAREAFIKARDLDICPLRMISPLEVKLQDIVRDTGVPFLNMHELLEDQNPNGILGDYWLVDHIHPSFEGHQLVAKELLRRMVAMRLVKLSADWEALAKSKFQEHFDSLDRNYFHEGHRKLEALRGWAAGRADGPPVETRFGHRLRAGAADGK